MEHRNSDSAKDNGGMFTGLLQMYNRGSQMASQSCFSVTNSGNFIPQRPAACHKTESPLVPEVAYGSDLSDYMERFPTNDSSNQILASEISSRMGCQHDAPSRMTSETLLDAISLAQRRLQHLEAIVRMMIAGRAVPHMSQQYHSLSMEFTSIMSQLSAATATFSSLSPFQVSPPIAPLANDNFDFGFDAFNEDDFKNVLGDGSVLPCPPTSGMDVLLSGFGRGVGVGVGLSSWTTDERVSPVGPMASSDELGNMFTAVLAQGNGDKCPVEKEALGNPPESGKAHVALEGDCLTPISIEEQREEDDDGESENLPPGSYELVELAATEILAEHTHFCEICGKGFKRDANLRMHMRGHGDEYKTAAALARPDKLPRASSVMKPRRYSCPYTGCKRNKQHPKFQPLKTMLCVKNHYRRSHCPKILVCSRCKAKKFSVNADLKTHEKHCGQDRWQCSCGTTFSRKDKLYGHVGLFVGHTPAALVQDKPDSHGSGLEALTSSGTNAAGIPVNLTKDNVKTNFVNGSQELVPAIVANVHESENSLREQSSK